MKNFLVYKSSAGSGKTYTLMLVYLGIVLKEPSRFRNILAITFTNKAANEIKQRIISNLKMLLALDKNEIPEKHKHLIDSLKQSTGLELPEVRDRAAKVLTLILHNYGDFAVSTIDSFMHRIIRSFSFDLKLSMNFEVEMNTAMLQAETVDSLLSSVGSDKHITDVLVKFVQERAESDESWQIERDLQKFSSNLFREDAIALLPHLGEFTADKLASVNRKLSDNLRSFEEELIKPAEKAMQLIESYNIDPELFYYGKKGIYNFFRKIVSGDIASASEPNSYVIKTIENNEWLSGKGKKSADGNTILEISPQLTDFYKEIEALGENGQSKYLIYKNIRNNLYPMAVLGELSIRLQAVKKERNVVSIAEFNRIISDIVANEPVPFIYERTGEKFRHYLIDEFQDTSVLQWQNLLPLVENSLSHGGTNMIVGDGKQAIYRFRNGEVEQFVKLPEIDNPQGNELIVQRAQVLEREYAPNQLGANFRSRCEVVGFNNDFFNFATSAFLPDFQKVYEGARQIADAKNTGGLVRVEFFEGERNEFDEYNCSRVLDLIGELTAAGYQPGDITVLCRSNKNSSNVASFLNANGIKVVSSDSLLLARSPEVNFLVNFLSFLNDNNNSISRTAIVNYLSEKPVFQEIGKHNAYVKANSSEGFFTMLVSAGFAVSTHKLRGLSLYDTCEELIRIFGLHIESPVYMQFFLDEILKYSSSKNTGIAGFLDFWEQNKSKLSLVLPLSRDAVQIMTIHKSKGLEFPVVIYAFADDDFKKLTNQSSWIELNDPDLEELPVALIKIEKALEKTHLSEIYTKEYSKTKLDLLNLIYVAFTRAAERLYVLTGKPPKEADELKSVQALMQAFLISKKMYTESNNTYEFGDNPNVKNVHAPLDAESALPVNFLTNDWRSRLVFAGRAPRVWQAESPGGVQASGNLLHLALSLIIVPDDIDAACDKILNQGYITDADLPELKSKLQMIVGHPAVRPFFGSKGQVAVESEILAPGGKSFRPDRIVFHNTHTDLIDYKAGKPLESHKNQIRQYASLLNEMGYPDIRSWLVYLEAPVEVVSVG